MSGTWWALAAGMGFGLFQAANRRAVRDLDVYLSTFLQLVFSSVVLGSIAAATGELSLLRTMRLPALIDFAMSGLLHFFIGWTLLNASQKRIGAARTSPLLSTVPLFGTVVAALALREIPGVVALIGVVLVVAGVYLISIQGARDSHALAGRPERPVPLDVGWRGSLFGLGAALCWSISPVFVRRGLAELPSPLLGLLIGILASLVVYGVGMPFWRRAMGGRMRIETLTFKFVAGSLVGLSQWARWIALGLAPVGVVLSLTQVSVPVAILLSPVFVGRQLEQVTARVWLGATVVICGSVLLVFTR